MTIKNLLKKIDSKFFGEAFIKKYRSSYSIKKIKSSHKKYVTNIDNLRQYKSLTYWNNHFNHLSANDVDGDIVECGVGNGQTLSYILFNLSYNEKHFNRRYIGFDSFQGFPEPTDEDNSPRNPKKGEWHHTNEEFVISNLNDLGFKDINYKKIKFIKGFYDRTFQQYKDNITKISLLHIDCDLYSSTKISLETWFDKIEENGIIVFDEYLNAAIEFPGAVKAIDEFLGVDKNKIRVCPYTKQYYFIKT